MQSDCIFCRIIGGQIPSAKVLEDQDVLAFLDIGPVSEGHTLVVSKRHYPTVDSCPEVVLAAMIRAASRLAVAILKATGGDGYNLLCNNGRAAGQVVEHVHMHLIPRKVSDGLFDKWPSFTYPQGRIEQIAQAIRKNL